MTKIYTKTGDKGTTSLVGGQRVSKTDIRLQAYGTVDELNAFLGLLKSKLSGEERNIIHVIQNTLMRIGANLATDTTTTKLPDSAKISSENITFLEENIDKMNDQLPKLTNFIIYGEEETSALAHVCRAITRRAERMILEAKNQVIIDEYVVIYMNRLSDFLFVLARFLTKKNNSNDFFWEK